MRGYITVGFYGDFAEKILNLCVSHHISIWNSRLCKNGIETCVFAKDTRKLRIIVRKSKVKVKILKKSGLPFKIAKHKKRTGLFLGAVLFILFLEFMSGFIWNIEIVGNSKVKSEEILSLCKDIGIYEGVRADSIDARVCREKLLLKSDKLAWASLNVEGCLLTVNVTEITDADKNGSEPCNLKASADGIIKKIDVTQGNCVVKVGDTVKKGDVLVSGVLEKANNTQFVHSAGVIKAESTRIFESKGKFQKTVKENNGKVKTKYALEIFTVKIPLFLGGESEEYYSETKIKKAELFSKSLPLKLYKRKFIFYEERVIKLSQESLLNELEADIQSQIESLDLKSYTVSRTEKNVSSDEICLIKEIKATENIAVEDEILLSAQ